MTTYDVIQELGKLVFVIIAINVGAVWFWVGIKRRGKHEWRLDCIIGLLFWIMARVAM